MPKYEATGIVRDIAGTVEVSDKFQKREFVVEIADNPKYPQKVQFQATGDRCSLLDRVSVGDTVKIEFDLRGREWRSPKGEIKHFNSLDAWKIDVTIRAPGAHNSPKQAGPEDDLPF